jgi:hypothetical protein
MQMGNITYTVSCLMARYADTPTMAAYRTANFLPRLQRG